MTIFCGTFQPMLNGGANLPLLRYGFYNIGGAQKDWAERADQ